MRGAHRARAVLCGESTARLLRHLAGLRTDGNARVLDEAGQPIAGLYAAGTDMASVFGGWYPSGGINLGPALTFGYVAGRHIAGAQGYE